jgi:hypothetical protein
VSDTKEFLLTKGFFALVDRDTFDALVKLNLRWFATTRKHTTYAARDRIVGKVKVRIYLHRWILDAPDHLIVDHINGNGLDNRRSNLRIVTTSENSRNRVRKTPGGSDFLGVAKISKSENWRAYAHDGESQICIGVWPTQELAASARDHYVEEKYPTARLNFPNGTPHGIVEVASMKIEKVVTDHPGIRFKNGAWEVWNRVDRVKKYGGRFKTLEEARIAQAHFSDRSDAS